MTTFKGNASRFTQYLWLTSATLVVFSLLFVAYVRAEKQIDRANDARHQAILLAGEVRQSSDDLTRMARAHVVTADPIYKQHYQEILDIRDGRKPRPADYGSGYWDLVLANQQRRLPLGPAIPLLQSIKEAGFTEPEFALLAQAMANSEALTRTELSAMALVESPDQPNQAHRALAIGMVYGKAYDQAKAGIMLPIGQFSEMVNRRTLEAVQTSKQNATRLRVAFILAGALLLLLLWTALVNLRAILGGSVKKLHLHIMRLGRGEFASPVPVVDGAENSVLGWLSETQIGLARIDAQRKDAQAKNQRLTQLYAALSQCNQAIVRCTSQAELFAQTCRVMVEFGGMNMAWIGALDEQRRLIRPVASFGRGTEYLHDLQISVVAAEPTGRGPVGTAYRENVPVWCQDFLHDPSTVPWHERGARFGWASAAALPLHQDGVVGLVLAVYARVRDAFDADVRKLLVEMSMDIDYAVTGFRHQAQREQAQQALRESEQRLRTIIETEPECVKVLDSSGQLLEMNPAGLAMLEADSLEEAQQRKLTTFIMPAYRASFEALHRRALQNQSGMLEFEIEGLKGTRRWLETHIAPMRDGSGAITMVLGITRDITARKQAQERVHHLAHYDALTGLPNRIQLDDHARQVIALAQQSHGSVALMFLDLDHFKDINDSLGHSVGDALLVDLARRVRPLLREQDTASRLGGDEFIFLLPGMDAGAAAGLAQTLLDSIADPFRIEPYDLNVTGSIGIAVFPGDGSDMETLFKSADAAMYRAKQEGRSRFCFFTEEMQVRSIRNLQLVNALRKATRLDQLRVHYQPQVSLQGRRIVGVEALLRWTHPELGAIAPAEFIPAAEDSGMILPIGEWVLRQAVRQLKQWMDAGLAPMVMAVNLSVVQFRHPDLPRLVTRILDEEGLPPEYLDLELTESVAMRDPQGAIAVMNDLHERGVRMSIDDFGTGFSSLSYLKKFKVYKLKIDQSFVRDIGTDPEDRAIVTAIISMARNLGLQTLAEGVETGDQLAFLREQGCDQMQGFHFSKPLPPDEFEILARSRDIRNGDLAD